MICATGFIAALVARGIRKHIEAVLHEAETQRVLRCYQGNAAPGGGMGLYVVGLVSGSFVRANMASRRAWLLLSNDPRTFVS